MSDETGNSVVSFCSDNFPATFVGASPLFLPTKTVNTT